MATKPTIYQSFTTYNYTSGNSGRKYIVLHFTANNGDTAKNNVDYFNGAYRGASAHFFCDPNEIWQNVSLSNTAWHCGASTYYCSCRNSNSIGIEMCSKINSSGTYYFEQGTLNNAAALTRWLMEEYGIPIENVIRHYDVTHKWCPGPWVDDPSQFTAFKQLVQSGSTAHWAAQYLTTCQSKGWITTPDAWEDYDAYVSKAKAVALIDKVSGGTWPSEEDDTSIHWCQPSVISLCGKGIITDKTQWLDNPDALISKALWLALICNVKGGVSDKYKNRNTDHWARNCLDTLCDLAVITSPHEWDNDFEAPITNGMALASVAKAF